MSLLEKPIGKACTLPENRYNIGDDFISESSSNSSTDTENTHTQNNIHNEIDDNPTLTARMFNLFREFAVFCLVMVTLTALTKDPPKITKPPAAYPFFPQGSIVSDWYRGQISRAIETTRSNDIAFIMYYAPWDADSQMARQEFEMVADKMREYVSFAAVNCWQPQGECRIQYTKVYKWPVLIAYPAHGRGIQYNGPISAPHIMSFLRRVCFPIVLATQDEPETFNEVNIIAELDSSPGSLQFAVFYTVALNYLERDPQHRIKFYIRPALVDVPSLHLHLWNETLRYPTSDKHWAPDDILQWILKSTKQITTWLMPSGTKSLTIVSNLQNNPALILFTPKNPLHSNTDYYDMLQEIALDYNNCGNNPVLDSNAHDIKQMRTYNRERLRKLMTTCKGDAEHKKTTEKIITNISNVCANCSSCPMGCTKNECNIQLQNRINTIYGVNSIKEKCSIPENHYGISIFTVGNNDAKSPKNLLSHVKKEVCRQFEIAEKFEPAIFVKEHPNDAKGILNITGLHCASNRTLSLFAMDSILHYQFAEKFGIDLSKRADKSAIVIVDNNMETHHIMTDPINTETVKQFINNFTLHQLNRSLDSTITINLTNTLHSIFNERIINKTNVIIKELNTESFLPTVYQNNKVVIVLYYSKQCSFCSGISHNFLTVAKKLLHVEHLLFTRIDGETNNLPWEYTMETYPTILLFPAKSKSESRVFPSNVPITVPNLIGFILANIDSRSKLSIMWSICNQTRLIEEKSTCNSSLLGETLTLIEKTLQEWRKSNKRLQQVHLHTLKQLRQLHLLFAHSSHKHQLIKSYLSKLLIESSHQDDYRNSARHSNATQTRKYTRDEL